MLNKSQFFRIIVALLAIMKKILYKISSFLMALLVLFSTFSFTIESHFCGDTLVDSTLFGNAKSCGMEVEKADNSLECSIAKKNCCTDNQISVEGQDELNISFEKLTIDQQEFVKSFVYSYIKLFEYVEENNTSFNSYPPPLIVKNIYKLDEVYLI